MGSYYVACSLSGLSITDDDPMYIQLMIDNRVKHHKVMKHYNATVGDEEGDEGLVGEKGCRVSNEGFYADFIPFGFPILGEYADCGLIDEVDYQSREVKLLEDYFGMKLSAIIECAEDDRWIKYGEDEDNDRWKVDINQSKIELLKALSITYYHKDVYDEFSKIQLKNKFDKDDLERNITRTTNFVKQHNGSVNIKDHPRYQKMYDMLADDETDHKNTVELDIIIASYLQFSDDHDAYSPFRHGQVDMLKALDLQEEDYGRVATMCTLSYNMGSMYQTLQPSNYASQEDNFSLTRKMNACRNKVIKTINKRNEPYR
jgi:hypothetical protein